LFSEKVTRKKKQGWGFERKSFCPREGKNTSKERGAEFKKKGIDTQQRKGRKRRSRKYGHARKWGSRVKRKFISKGKTGADFKMGGTIA